QIQDLHGLPASDIRMAITLEIQRYKYFSLRYRKFIVVGNDEIANYFNTKYVPEAKSRGIAVPELTPEVEKLISANLFEEKVNSEFEKSLESLRARSNIEI